MNREIKFRLRYQNKIVGYEKWYPGAVDADGWQRAEPIWLYSKDGNTWSPQEIRHTHKDYFTLYKDARKKEIYEGDVLVAEWTTEGLPEYPDEKDWLCFVGEVEWKQDSLGWGFKANPIEWWQHCPIRALKKLIAEGCLYSSRYTLTRDIGEDTPELTIIGNIYENPELLEGK